MVTKSAKDSKKEQDDKWIL